MSRILRKTYATLAPGILVAATGVGAGDLITAGFAGSQVGTFLLWTPLVGALLKWTLNEGIARWQMATETTLLEGWSTRFGKGVRWAFFVYFLGWSFFVGGALINACGVAGDGFFRWGDPKVSQTLWGVVHSLFGLGLVWRGGFSLFEKVMSFCIGVMFVSVLATALLVRPEWETVLAGLTRPHLSASGVPWALGVLGGVGGTVTLLSYGYWIRESGRRGWEGLRTSRVDLGVAYALTGLFGAAMILIGSRMSVEKSGADVALRLAEQLEEALGLGGRWIFLLGFWGAVFTSLLGVWQSAPYLFADFLALNRAQKPPADLARTKPYRLYLVALAIVPMVTFGFTVKQVQLAYAVMGAFFMPLLALTLLWMNNRTAWVGKRFRNGWVVNGLLGVTILLFGSLAVLQFFGRLPFSVGG